MEDEPSSPNSVAVDAKGIIIVMIVGLINNTLSVHHADGTFIEKFATDNVLRRVSATLKEEIVVRFDDDSTLKLMNYSGGNAKSIHPPDVNDVYGWNPDYVCCSHKYGEIFVGNFCKPGGVYRYTSDGEYLGVVTDEVNNPRSIALSNDERELFVVDGCRPNVKIFQRP